MGRSKEENGTTIYSPHKPQQPQQQPKPQQPQQQPQQPQQPPRPQQQQPPPPPQQQGSVAVPRPGQQPSFTPTNNMTYSQQYPGLNYK